MAREGLMDDTGYDVYVDEDAWNDGFKAGFLMAVDEFAEKAIKIVYEANNRNRNPQPRDMVADIHYKLRDLAEQLKEVKE